MPVKNTLPRDNCVIAILSCFVQDTNILRQLVFELDDYIPDIIDDLSIHNEKFQKKSLESYIEYMQTEACDNPIQKADFDYLKSLEVENQPTNAKLLKVWLDELDAHHKKRANQITHQFLSSNTSNVLIKIKPNDSGSNLSVVMPLYQSLFFQKERLTIENTEKNNIISFPSVSNVFDLFDDDWFKAIEYANTAAINEFGYKLTVPNGQLFIRWAIDFSKCYSEMGINPDNASRLLVGKNRMPRTVCGESAGAAFSISTLQLLARAYINYPELFIE